MHAFPSGPSYPTSQMQSVIASLPKSELVLAGQLRHTDPPVTFRYVPAAQSEHMPDPFTPLYVPSGQAEQAAPSDPSYPTLQMQSVTWSLPTIESVFPGQAAH
eukprot:3369386-Rhodomonas_salina.1